MNSHESMLRIAADSDISVLLLGESGSGKEVAAQFIHNHSKRASGPFVALNCGAIAKGLAESILEGYRKGAFTGASEERLGIVRSANHGTLFLDEIGEMPLETQCKLLRILQERTVTPIGDYEAFPVDFRLICATNRDLRSDICAGKFREDLFFRINVFPVTIPPLRERADFENIANDLWYDAQKIYSAIPNASKQGRRFDEFEMFLLKSKQWPGNIRQLKNVIQRYALLKPHGYSLTGILDDEFSKLAAGEKGQPYDARMHAPEWEIIEKAIKCCGGNKSQAAQVLGISRGSLSYQIKKRVTDAPQTDSARN
ncbi:sigma-54 dependent transcriptional regulator [uncultured Fibrobacter sp.]|uniref:sigma 54-interacting transcriptional regulator n=1 Tax=uncultured Fibrobacter sp. TaxID=261512 RepID=UPI002628A27D|nr:sigma-54 dependent transcriptional regulator [uncultured Fibrobacter sp.]